MKKLSYIALTVALLAFSFQSGAGQVGKNQGVLNPNLASEKELAALPQLNPTIIKGLIEKRPFLRMSELHAYLTSQSLNQNQLKELYVKLFVPINLNTATAEELLLVPGMGPKMKHEFEEYRPYRALAQFRKEIGKYVNAAEVARFEQYVFVPINLNTASDEDILSIPGVGQRMLREFKEYRPYRNIEQFRKEIGKYVNAKEVARLESYVTLN